MGTGMVSIINPILVALGDGWAYTLLGGLCVLVSPLLSKCDGAPLGESSGEENSRKWSSAISEILGA